MHRAGAPAPTAPTRPLQTRPHIPHTPVALSRLAVPCKLLVPHSRVVGVGCGTPSRRPIRRRAGRGAPPPRPHGPAAPGAPGAPGALGAAPRPRPCPCPLPGPTLAPRAAPAAPHWEPASAAGVPAGALADGGKRGGVLQPCDAPSLRKQSPSFLGPLWVRRLVVQPGAGSVGTQAPNCPPALGGEDSTAR